MACVEVTGKHNGQVRYGCVPCRILYGTRAECEAHQVEKKCRPDLKVYQRQVLQKESPQPLPKLQQTQTQAQTPARVQEQTHVQALAQPEPENVQVEHKTPAVADAVPPIFMASPSPAPQEATDALQATPDTAQAQPVAQVSTQPVEPLQKMEVAAALSQCPTPVSLDHAHVPPPEHAHSSTPVPAPLPVTAPTPEVQHPPHGPLARWWAPAAHAPFLEKLENALGKTHVYNTPEPPSGGGMLHVIVVDGGECCCKFLEAMTKVAEGYKIFVWDASTHTVAEMKKPVPPLMFVKVPSTWKDNTPLCCEGFTFVPPVGSAGTVIAVATGQQEPVVDTSQTCRAVDVEDEYRELTGNTLDCGKVRKEGEHMSNVAYIGGSEKSKGYGLGGEECTLNAIAHQLGMADARHARDQERTLDAFAR